MTSYINFVSSSPGRQKLHILITIRTTIYLPYVWSARETTRNDKHLLEFHQLVIQCSQAHRAERNTLLVTFSSNTSDVMFVSGSYTAICTQTSTHNMAICGKTFYIHVRDTLVTVVNKPWSGNEKEHNVTELLGITKISSRCIHKPDWQKCFPEMNSLKLALLLLHVADEELCGHGEVVEGLL